MHERKYENSQPENIRRRAESVILEETGVYGPRFNISLGFSLLPSLIQSSLWTCYYGGFLLQLPSLLPHFQAEQDGTAHGKWRIWLHVSTQSRDEIEDIRECVLVKTCLLTAETSTCTSPEFDPQKSDILNNYSNLRDTNIILKTICFFMHVFLCSLLKKQTPQGRLGGSVD